MDKPKKMKIDYIYKDGYSIDIINGAYGNMSSSGDFIAHFYYEMPDLAKSIEIEFDGNGTANERYKENIINRHVKCGITMNYETAKKVRDWLTRNIDVFEEGTSKKDDN